MPRPSSHTPTRKKGGTYWNHRSGLLLAADPLTASQSRSANSELKPRHAGVRCSYPRAHTRCTRLWGPFCPCFANALLGRPRRAAPAGARSARGESNYTETAHLGSVRRAPGTRSNTGMWRDSMGGSKKANTLLREAREHATGSARRRLVARAHVLFHEDSQARLAPQHVAQLLGQRLGGVSVADEHVGACRGACVHGGQGAMMSSVCEGKDRVRQLAAIKAELNGSGRVAAVEIGVLTTTRLLRRRWRLQRCRLGGSDAALVAKGFPEPARCVERRRGGPKHAVLGRLRRCATRQAKRWSFGQ